jgi:hypothetical protein
MIVMRLLRYQKCVDYSRKPVLSLSGTWKRGEKYLRLVCLLH